MTDATLGIDIGLEIALVNTINAQCRGPSVC